jgi:Fe-S-cluster containining protein
LILEFGLRILGLKRIRIHILGASPCDRCFAACCKQNGHEFAAILQGDDERRRFAAFSVDVTFARGDGSIAAERVLPYVGGRCQFLADGDRCTIYDDRPRACRQFECAPQFNRDGLGRHGKFLSRNPRVLRILESM